MSTRWSPWLIVGLVVSLGLHYSAFLALRATPSMWSPEWWPFWWGLPADEIIAGVAAGVAYLLVANRKREDRWEPLILVGVVLSTAAHAYGVGVFDAIVETAGVGCWRSINSLMVLFAASACFAAIGLSDAEIADRFLAINNQAPPFRDAGMAKR